MFTWKNHYPQSWFLIQFWTFSIGFSWIIIIGLRSGFHVKYINTHRTKAKVRAKEKKNIFMFVFRWFMLLNFSCCLSHKTLELIIILLFIFRVEQHSLFRYYFNIINYFSMFFVSQLLSFPLFTYTCSHNRNYTRSNTKEKKIWKNSMKWGLLNIDFSISLYVDVHSTFIKHLWHKTKNDEKQTASCFRFSSWILLLLDLLTAYIVLSSIWFNIKTWITFYLDCFNY